jgi:peptide/nickel transport system permease protein
VNYVLRRLLRAALLLVALSALCFLFTEIAPGSFFDEMRLNPQVSPETISSLRARYGLDQSIGVRYARWINAAAHLDFGYSIAYNLPVTPLLWSRAKNTLLLTSTAMLVSWFIAVPLAFCAALRPDSLLDRFLSAINSVLVAVPEVIIAIMLLAVVVRWHLLPLHNTAPVDHDTLSFSTNLAVLTTRMLLPIAILILVEMPIIIRHVRTAVLETLQSPFVRAARGLGIPSTRLLVRHVLPVAANPAISLLGFSLAGLLSGSLLVEVVCGWPGLGPLILEATLARDLYLVIGGIMFSALFMLAGTLAADVLLVISDPRIRTGAPDAA